MKTNVLKVKLVFTVYEKFSSDSAWEVFGVFEKEEDAKKFVADNSKDALYGYSVKYHQTPFYVRPPIGWVGEE